MNSPKMQSSTSCCYFVTALFWMVQAEEQPWAPFPAASQQVQPSRFNQRARGGLQAVGMSARYNYTCPTCLCLKLQAITLTCQRPQVMASAAACLRSRFQGARRERTVFSQVSSGWLKHHQVLQIWVFVNSRVTMAHPRPIHVSLTQHKIASVLHCEAHAGVHRNKESLRQHAVK